MTVRASATRVFWTLRVRLTLSFFLAGLVGFSVLAGVVMWRDASADASRTDAVLLGEASRAAGLVYMDGRGAVRTDAVANDHIRRQSAGIVVLDVREGSPRTLLQTGAPADVDWGPLAHACVTDRPEDGVHGTVGRLRAAGVPWRGETSDPRPLGCAFAYLLASQPAGSDVAVPAAAGSLLLLLLLTGIVWWTAGRSLAVAETALSDRERFLATAAHEMRGPLARMRAVSEDALHEVRPDAPVAERLRLLVDTADRAGRVVSNLLLASRIDHAEVPVQSAPVRLDELAVEVETLTDGVVVDITEPVEIRGDQALLRQALVNLVDNAHRHGGDGPILLSVTRQADAAVVRVADDGPGFPPGVDIARPYVSGSSGGNGLGLPLVQWIADRNGATMWLGAAEGRDGMHGAAVELRFPAATDPRG